MKLVYLMPVIMLIMTGCNQTKTTQVNKPKERNYFNKAYDHGCSTQEGIYKKNIRRYVKDASYQDGWNEGYFHCGEKIKGKEYGFDEQAYKDGYLSAYKGKSIIKYRNESYRKSWKKGYEYYKSHPIKN